MPGLVRLRMRCGSHDAWPSSAPSGRWLTTGCASSAESTSTRFRRTSGRRDRPHRLCGNPEHDALRHCGPKNLGHAFNPGNLCLLSRQRGRPCCDGRIVAAAQEERFTRRKHDPDFPSRAVAYCLDEASLAAGDIDYVAFYEKPLRKFDRLLETYFAFAPRGFRSFSMAMPIWAKDKLYMGRTIRKALGGNLRNPSSSPTITRVTRPARSFQPV